jgi:hypothetical protein
MIITACLPPPQVAITEPVPVVAEHCRSFSTVADFLHWAKKNGVDTNCQQWGWRWP